MSTNDFFSKDVLFNIIEGNLDILRQCIEGTIYQQWTAVILLLQFIEYLLKYKIQCAGKYFEREHKLTYLYGLLTDDDRNDVEANFSKLIKNRKPTVPGSFDSIKEFARRYNTSYQFWRYGIPTNSDQSDPEEKYFYLADTVTVLHALIESTDLGIDLPVILDVYRVAERIQKPIGSPWN